MSRIAYEYLDAAIEYGNYDDYDIREELEGFLRDYDIEVEYSNNVYSNTLNVIIYEPPALIDDIANLIRRNFDVSNISYAEFNSRTVELIEELDFEEEINNANIGLIVTF